MPKCPICGEEIHELRIVHTKHGFDTLRVKDSGVPETIEGEDTDWYLSHYECPECNEVVLSENSDAVAFLKGENKD